ncbi:MAG TPA: hypothetical protein PK929_18190 [Quisquiliibacterium sp.]|nr:hypothetical protein [Quisquiliibacterium sp.]
MKTLRVTLADIVGPTGVAVTGSTAVVTARYVDTSGRGRDVHLTDGTIVVPVRRTVAPGTVPQHFDFDVYANDAAPVREVDYGHLVEVSWTVVAPTGAKSSGVKRVQITDDMDAVVQLGLLTQPTPVAPYTGGYALAPDLAAEVATRAAADAALDIRVDALEVTPPAHTHPLADVTDAGTAAASDVGDFATAAQGAKADSASQPGHAHAGGDITSGTVAYARLPVGTAASTLAAGDDSRITGAAQKSANLSDLADAATARSNLGLNTAATVGALPIPDPGAYFTTDTVTGALQQLGGRERYGTGSPEGVVTAPVGTYYTDTAITNGAMRWAKKTGTGNTGWKCIEGDTGWRDLSTGLLNGWAGAAGSVLIKRTPDQIHLLLENLGGASATATAILALPVGFRSIQARTMRPMVHNAAGAVQRLLAFETGAVNFNGTVPQALPLYGYTAWPAASTWPTTLPGVAA